jgi:cobalt-zinc-cadmium efflux system outer membrane protein
LPVGPQRASVARVAIIGEHNLSYSSPSGRRLRRLDVSLLLACLLASPNARAQPAAAGPAAAGLTFDRAIALALERSPQLQSQSAELRRAEAELLGSRVYPFNPVIEASQARRDDGQEQTHDREVGISQEVEIAGQRGKRIAAASGSLDVIRLRVSRARQELAANVGEAFVLALQARELEELARFEQEIARSLAEFEQRRLDAGAGTLVDLNLARAAEGRAQRRVELAIAAETAARATVAERIGLSPADLPGLEGELPESWPNAAPLQDLEIRAIDQRQDLAALKIEIETSAARLRLEQSLAAPNLVLGLATGREADRDNLDTVVAGVTIPLFNRNQGGIATARANQESAAADLALATLALRSEVATAASRYHATTRALAVFRETVAGTLDENLELVQKSFASGKLRASEVLVFRREFVDSRRELIEAAADAWLARIALDLTTGDTQLPTPNPDSTPSTAPETPR